MVPRTDRRRCRSQPETSAPGQCNGSGRRRAVQLMPEVSPTKYVATKNPVQQSYSGSVLAEAAEAHDACFKLA